MSGWCLNTPVAFFIFRRPETTARVFDEIRRARPGKLLLVADGPRPDRAGEAEKCAAARLVVDAIDWDCEVVKNYSDTNMGCRRRMSSGLDWVFDTVEEAIILEDDCLPHPTFFRFCEELLGRYRHDERVAMIRGDNWPETRLKDFSYRFTIYPSVWGWASWRRVWKNYDVAMKPWPEVKNETWFADWLGTESTRRLWVEFFDDTYSGKIDTWDFQFVLSAWCGSQLSITPSVNLIANIGGGPDGTNVLAGDNPRLDRKLEEMPFPLKHPEHLVRYKALDAVSEVPGARLEMELSRRAFFASKAVEKSIGWGRYHYLRAFAGRVYRRLLRGRQFQAG